jgi:hypothetical protein
VTALRPGVRAARRPAAEVVSDAERRGAVAHLVGPAASKPELLEEFARALRFPAWVGRNWDALADALGDLSWLPAGSHVVVWVGPTALRGAQPAEYATALEVLRHATSASAGTDHPLTVLLAPE